MADANRQELPRFLTIPEITRRTNLGRRVIAEAIERGDLLAARPHTRAWYRIGNDDLLRWLRAASLNANHAPDHP